MAGKRKSLNEAQQRYCWHQYATCFYKTILLGCADHFDDVFWYQEEEVPDRDDVFITSLGLDPSLSGFGICGLALHVDRDISDFEVLICKSVSTSFTKATHQEALEAIYREVKNCFSDVHYHFIVSEDINVGKSFTGLRAVSKANAAWALALRLSGTPNKPHVAVNLSRLKKMTGCGSADKDDVLRYIKDTYGVECPDDNAADAFLASIFGLESCKLFFKYGRLNFPSHDSPGIIEFIDGMSESELMIYEQFNDLKAMQAINNEWYRKTKYRVGKLA